MLKKWASIGNIPTFERTLLSTEKNIIIRSLNDNTATFLNKICQGDEELENFLKEAILRYTMSFKFNLLLSIANRLKGTYKKQFQPSVHLDIFRNIIFEQWEKQPLEIMLQTRLLSSLICKNTTFPYDLTVYRGVVDTRQKKMLKSQTNGNEQIFYLQNLKKVTEMEEFIKPRLIDPDPSITSHVLKTLLNGEDLSHIQDEDDPLFLSEEMQKEVENYFVTSGLQIQDIADDSIAIFEKLNIGDQYICNNFMSTSLVKSHSQKFYEEGYCCFLEIFIPAFTPMLYISPFGNYTYNQSTGKYDVETDEFEVLLPPSATFTVRSSKNYYVRLHYQGCRQLKEDFAELVQQWKIITQAEELKSQIQMETYDNLVSIM